jgi:choline transport protein
MFVVKDMDAILNAPSGLPLIQLYHQATGSRTITFGLMVAFTVCFFACAVAIITGSSRTLWSAARDDCFPRSDLWKQISPRFEMPMNAVLLQACFSVVGDRPASILFLPANNNFAALWARICSV